MRIFQAASQLPVSCLCSKVFIKSCEQEETPWEEEERSQMLSSTAAAALAGMGAGAKPKRKTKCPSKACFCAILTVWQFACIIAIIVCSVLFLKPFLRVVRYRATRCRVESLFVTNQYVCECGDGCRSLYPCVLVHVSFNDSYGDTNTVALYSDDLHQANVYEEKYHGLQKCSLRVCNNSEHINRQFVDNFLKKYGQKGSTFPCYYDWYSYQWGAIIEHKLPRMRVLHAMVWPFLALLLGTLTCIIFCKRCRRITVEKSEKQSDSTKDKPLSAEEINLTENTEPASEKTETATEEVKLKPQPSNKTKSKTKPPRRDKTKVAETPNSTEKRNVWL